MIVSILIGREGSSGFPGKNFHQVLGRPLAAYSILASNNAPSVDRLYLSTDSERLIEIGNALGASIIRRPPELCTNAALGEDAYRHAHQVIREELAAEGKEPELYVLLMANAATVTSAQIEEGIAALRADDSLDSAVTVSCYNMWSPLRARRIDAQGLLEPFVPFETFGDPATLNCDRDSQGDVWFADMGCSIVRPRNLDHLHTGLLPQKWMGRRIMPLKNVAGLDLDYAWQLGQVEAWLRLHDVKPLED